MKSFSALNRRIPRFTFRESLFQFQTCTSLPSQNLEVDSIQSISENPLICLLRLCRTLSSLRKIHALLIVNGETDDPLLKTKLVSLYGTFGHVKHARLLFDEIRNPDIDSCKVMIRWYFMNDLNDEIIGFYKFMRRRFLVLDNIVLSIVLKACSELRDFVEGRKLHGYIVQLGSPDSFVLTGLVDMYAKCGEIDTACKVFERIRDRNVVCWTSMIVGYVQNNCAKEALLLFNRMRECLVEGNAYTLGSVVTACARLGALHQGKWVHGNVIKNGIEVNSYLFTSILDMYVKCAAIWDARLIFDEVSIIDLVSWTAMIVGYAQSGFAEEALLLFTDKKWQNVYPNSVTLASVLSACAQSGNPNLGSSVQGLAIKLGQGDANVMNAVVDMYAKCSRIEDAVYLFESMVDKDVVSWNSILSGYSRNGYAYEAMRLFNRMRANCFRPDPVTLVTLLSVCASLEISDLALLFTLSPSEEAFRHLRTVFDEMAEKNMVTWTAMIGGYGKQGDSNECLELFNDMLKENIEPTDIIFTTILSACSHTGMIREGWRLFQTMSQAYEFNPSMRHYASRGRWRQVGELRDLLKKKGLRKQLGSSQVDLYIGEISSQRAQSFG
ncbi:Pentatricopeptide repeat-containing protein, mitochondrial [Sesamum angolense]|uniref:Pentatricopeptide repeat-containing protein, mitochondrial n=1 Tax=Sesamum angolense TaxID=2727404 RepID=A0AAE1X0I6_9LAMI|nr:Pentatricopeptide repeat-containing protein, mitochondrial [Sesamum angolense]